VCFRRDQLCGIIFCCPCPFEIERCSLYFFLCFSVACSEIRIFRYSCAKLANSLVNTGLVTQLENPVVAGVIRLLMQKEYAIGPDRVKTDMIYQHNIVSFPILEYYSGIKA